MPQWSGGGMNLSAADLDSIDLGDGGVRTYQDFFFVDNDEEVFGGAWFDGAEPGDIFLVNIQTGYVSDQFQDVALILEADDNSVLQQFIFDEEALNTTFVLTGEDVIAGSQAPGNVDLVWQQVDSSDPGLNMSVNTTVVRLRRRATEDRAVFGGENGAETW